MQDYQLKLLQQIPERIDLFQTGKLKLEKLVKDIRGLYEAAAIKEEAIRDEFELLWSRIDAEEELRSEDWAPSGSANDKDLQVSLEDMKTWVTKLSSAFPDN